MSDVLETLCRRENLGAETSRQLFGEFFSGRIDPVRAGAILAGLRSKGETPDEIRGAATAMIEAARVFPRTEGEEVGEIVGTGGDCAGTINISTMTALAAAGCGLKIAKHGNRGVSSPSGASDVLTALGFCIDPSPEEASGLLRRTGFAFCFAQLYHPAMRFAAPVRKALGVRTIFNILGPLTNPARPDYALIGSCDPALLPVLAKTLRDMGMRRGMVVHGAGLDEAAVHGDTSYVSFDETGEFTSGVFTPRDFGVTEPVTLGDIRGGTPEDNARTAEIILSGHGTRAQTAVVAANLALLLLLGRKAKTLPEALSAARKAIEEGAALPVIQAHRAFAENRARSLH